MQLDNTFLEFGIKHGKSLGNQDINKLWRVTLLNFVVQHKDVTWRNGGRERSTTTTYFGNVMF